MAISWISLPVGKTGRRGTVGRGAFTARPNRRTTLISDINLTVRNSSWTDAW
jgi:hypothetical protein